jgi:hypothetical protein
VPLGLISQAAFGLPASTVALGVIGAGLSVSTAIVPFAVLRAEERLGDYLRVSAAQVLVGTVAWMRTAGAMTGSVLEPIDRG